MTATAWWNATSLMVSQRNEALDTLIALGTDFNLKKMRLAE